MYATRALLRVLMVAAVACAASGCRPASEKIILQREWTANAEYAGDIWATRVASGHGIQLEVREGSELADPVKMVRSGQAQFGVASADRVLRENEGGAGLVVIAAATYRSPVVFLTQQELAITSPSGFRGHTIGLQAGTNTELVFKALANAQKIPLQEMKIVESGWGTTTFETGTVDVLGAFAYDEPVSLRLKGKKFNQIEPEKYGVRYVGTVYFTRKALASDKPAVVQDFMNALVEGWQKALARPSEAIDMLANKFESVRNGRAKELESLEKGRPYFEGENNRVLYASKERWADMTSSLIALGELKTFDFNANIDYRFLDRASAR